MTDPAPLRVVRAGEARTTVIPAAKTSLVGGEGEVRVHRYFGEGGLSSRPQAHIVEMATPHAELQAHFHDVDQFQVVVAGTGRIGRHEVRPIAVHYADGFTPYGPIAAHSAGLSYFTLRLHAAAGSFHMPEQRGLLPGPRGRAFTEVLPADPGLPAGEARSTMLYGGFADELGIEVLHLGSRAGARSGLGGGGGQYLLVTAGELLDGQLPCGPNALAHVAMGEAAPLLTAGEEGATVLVMQFPRAAGRPATDPERLVSRAPGWPGGSA